MSYLPISALAPASGAGVDAQYLRKWRKAVSNARINTGQARLLCLGDSTTQAANAANDVVTGFSYPTQMANQLTARGITSAVIAGAKPFIGSNTTDSRVALSGFAIDTTGIGWVNYSWKSTATSSTITFTPQFQTDRLEVYYARVSGAGTFTVDVGAGTLATVNTSGATAMLKQTVSATKASNTWTITHSVTGAVFITWLVAYDSTTGRTLVLNGGHSGATTNDFTANGLGGSWGVQAHFPLLAPDLTIVSLGINDAVGATSPANYLSRLTTIVNSAKATGDVILLSIVPSNAALNANYGTFEPQYVAALPALAASLGVAYVDVPWGRWGGSYTAANDLGYIADGIHPNNFGYSDMGAAVANVLGLSA